MNLIQELYKKKYLNPGSVPKWLKDNIGYLTVMGSEAYGVSSGNSDVDIYGWCFPPVRIVFPHTVTGYIKGFGKKPAGFAQWQAHHIETERYEYDISVYGIVRYFQLLAENNPNMVDSLFTPDRCVLFAAEPGWYVREHRKDFLHKGSKYKLLGYAHSQHQKLSGKKPEPGSKREKLVQKFGYDTKFAYHLVRLVLQCQQILTEHDLDLQRNREVLKAVRRGEWTLEHLSNWWQEQQILTEETYTKSTLRNRPDYALLKSHLFHVLEMHYGSLSALNVQVPERGEETIKELINVLQSKGYV